MAIDNFNPTLWSDKLLVELKKKLVYGNLVNRDYEGELAQFGSSVKINSISAITINDYAKNSTTLEPEVLGGTQKTLTIDQAKDFIFVIDDIDQRQQNPKILSSAIEKAADNLRDVADKFVAGLYTGVASGNTIGSAASPVVPTAGNAYDYLVDLGVKLDEANVPETDRFVVVPPFFYGLLQKDARFVQGSGMAEQVRTNGFIGEANGLSVYKSNNVPVASGKYSIMAGHPSAISYVDNITSVESYRSQKQFGTVVRGLHVYGAALIRPEAIAVLTVSKA